MAHLRFIPDTIERLSFLADLATGYERAGDDPASEASAQPVPDGIARCVSYVSTPQGKKPLLKAVMTSACENNCHYCGLRAGRGRTRRESFTPDEIAQAFDRMQRGGIVDGIFLSSGILNGGPTVQDKIIDTIEIIRSKYQYQGYVHLKIMPGAEYDQVVRAMQIADRVSVNLEGPNPRRLNALAPAKAFQTQLLERLLWTETLRREHRHDLGIRASTVTQFVVGAVGETDLELLSTSAQLYAQGGITRAYYSAFSPITDTPFEGLSPASPRREFRLYQASFLLRDYEWDVEELPFRGEGNLPLEIDPKLAWADAHLREAPVEIMKAERRDLMRVPGIGPKGADIILKARRRGRISDLSHLHALGIRALDRLAPYVLLDGHRPAQQLRLF
jgi:predicted DNA-binding helix-hairpin-helix protein